MPKKDLWIINTRKRMIYGQTQVNPPSRFIDEIDDKYIELDNQTTSLLKKATTFSKEKMFTKEEVDYVVDSLKEIVERLRNMSPLYEDFVKKNQN